jgi:hypothetical protein
MLTGQRFQGFSSLLPNNSIREAIELHLEMLCQQGLPIPEPNSSGEFVEVLVAS